MSCVQSDEELEPRSVAGFDPLSFEEDDEFSLPVLDSDDELGVILLPLA